MKKIIDNKVIVNICELCSELAHKRLIEYYKEVYHHTSEEEIENMIMIDDLDEGTFVYTEQAQDMFNQLYDEYWTIIENLAL